MEFRNGTIGGEENGLVGAFPIERLRKDCRLAVRPHNPDRTIAEMPGEEMVSFHGDEQPGASQVVGYASEQPGRFLQHIANRFVHILFDDGSILLGKGFVKLVAKEPACRPRHTGCPMMGQPARTRTIAQGKGGHPVLLEGRCLILAGRPLGDMSVSLYA